MKVLGIRIKEEREARGLTQQQLSEQVAGLEQPVLQKIEKRKSRSSQYAPGIAKALGVNLEWLVSGTGSKYAQDERIADMVIASHNKAEEPAMPPIKTLTQILDELDQEMPGWHSLSNDKKARLILIGYDTITGD